MNLNRMRATCAALVQNLRLPVPAEPEQLVAALCARMGERLGVPVQHRLVSFPPQTVSGLWVATETVNYVLCERHTSAWHRLAIIAHEFWHMEAGHEATSIDDDGRAHLLFPSLEPTAVARIVAARTHCSELVEQEAELFGSLLISHVSRWMPEQVWAVPSHAADVVGRLEASLGHRPDGATP